MPLTTVKVHPAIGIARVGNSPTEFFIGPETADEPAVPPGGYKDAQCRIKRQGARFRLYGYDENGVVMDELTASDATITWRVELANRKASGPRFQGNTLRNASITAQTDRDKLDITPGEQAVAGPNQVVDLQDAFEVVGEGSLPVHLGQLRTDPDGRLIVLGGLGQSASPSTTTITSWSDNDTWHDDVSDGRVTATVQVGSQTFTAVAGWVIVAPPKFAPPIYNAITLYDTLFQLCRDAPSSHPAHVAEPASASFRRDIYPVLQAGKDIHGVYDVGSAHSSIDPGAYPLSVAQRGVVFQFLRGPSTSGSMPKLAQSPPLTATQYLQLQRWKDDTNFVDDWDPTLPPTPITPEALDRGPLSHAVGASFFPGIEGGAFLISTPDIYVEPLRLDPDAVQPGDVTRRMALPWQADFNACTASSSGPWWPVPRPLNVHPQSDPTSYVDWDDDIGSGTEMVTKWAQAGFVVRSGTELVQVERCATRSVLLLTPVLDFGPVQQNPMDQPGQTALAVVFEVLSPGAQVTLEVTGAPSDPAFETLAPTSVTVGPTGDVTPVKARLWVKFTTTTVGAVSAGTMVVSEQGGQQWTIDLQALTQQRQSTAVSLVLDRSGSMGDPAGTITKIEALRQAATLFVDTALQGDGVGIVSYNSDAVTHGTQVSELDPPGGFAGPRDELGGIISGLTPSGGTSIGDGLEHAANMLDASPGFARKATVVFTDGQETAPKYISEVASLIDSTTYGVGLGEPANIDTSTLATLTGNHGGYLLVTGPVSGDNRFVLKKYFLQVLAGVSNAEVVLDPQGTMVPGTLVREPFELTEDDHGLDVILLCDQMKYVTFGLETPTGEIIVPQQAAGVDLSFVKKDGHALYRLRLPTLFTERVGHAGRWHALFGIRTHLPESRDRGSAGFTHATSAEAAPHAATERATMAALAMGRRTTHARASRAAALEHAATAIAAAAGARRPVAAASTTAAPTATHVPRDGLRYSLIVHAYSNLRLRAELHQRSFEPGAEVRVTARLSRLGIPFAGTAKVFAELTPPDGAPTQDLPLDAGADGTFLATFVADAVGVHRVRVRAHGRTIHNQRFTREQTLTAAIARGADSPSTPPTRDPRPGDTATGDGTPEGPDTTIDSPGCDGLCAALLCMLDGGVVSPALRRALKRSGIDLDRAATCLRKHCRDAGHRDVSTEFDLGAAVALLRRLATKDR